jgi:hypothetical protein
MTFCNWVYVIQSSDPHNFGEHFVVVNDWMPHGRPMRKKTISQTSAYRNFSTIPASSSIPKKIQSRSIGSTRQFQSRFSTIPASSSVPKKSKVDRLVPQDNSKVDFRHMKDIWIEWHVIQIANFRRTKLFGWLCTYICSNKKKMIAKTKFNINFWWNKLLGPLSLTVCPSAPRFRPNLYL